MSLSLFARKTVICWCLAAASPAVVFGQSSSSPQGVEYAIAGALPGDQTYPCAAINPNGGYLVWQDNAVAANGLRIRAESLNGDLIGAGAPFAVSTVAMAKTTGDQEKPQVALLQGGGAVVVWQGGKSGFQQVFARFLGAAAGSFITKDLRISTHTRNNQINPHVVTLSNGSVVVVWSSFGQDGSLQGIFARLFSAAGRPLGDEFQVNQYFLNNQRNPAVAALANDNFVVVWISELQRSSSSVDVFARIFNNSGLPAGDEFPVNATTANICANPVVAASSQGGFAVAWAQNENLGLTAGSPIGVPVSGVQTSPSANNWDIFGCLFDGNGTATTAPFRINSYTYGDQYAPRIAALGANYMAVWTSLSQTNLVVSSGQTNLVVDPLEGVYGQWITGSGSLVLSNDLHVNTTTISRQIHPTVASDGANRFLTLWSSFAPYGNFDLFAQQYFQPAGQ